jgi:hypothetical protein
MVPEQRTAAIITGLITLALFAYVSFAIRGKGPLLSNKYLFASKEERMSMDVKAEYKLVSTVFFLLGIGFLLITINIIASRLWLFCAAAGIFLLSAIYAVAHTVRKGE